MSVQEVTNSSRESISILGVRIDRVSMDQTMDRLREFVRSGRPHFVITADASGIVQAQTDAEYRALYAQADLVTPDSAGVLWAARRNGTPLPGRVSGVDLVDRLCAESADFGHRIFFLGAAPGVAELAAERMRLKYPGCHIVGSRHGYFPAESDGDVIDFEVSLPDGEWSPWKNKVSLCACE